MKTNATLQFPIVEFSFYEKAKMSFKNSEYSEINVQCWAKGDLIAISIRIS